MVRSRVFILTVALMLFGAACASDDDDPAAPTTAAPDSTIPSTTRTEPTVVTTTVATTTTAAPTTTSAPTTTVLTIDDVLDRERREGIPIVPARYPVAIYGDSMAESAREHMVNFLTSGGRLRVSNYAFPGTSLCVALPTMETDLRREQIWAALFIYTNNTFVSCMHDDAGVPLDDDAAIAKFAADLDEALAITGEVGVRSYLVTIPLNRVEALDRSKQPMSARVNEVLTEAAERHDHAEVVEAARAVLGPDGEYVETLPCLPTEPCTGGVDDDGVPVNIVRDPFGGHFCTSGFGDRDETFAENIGLCPVWDSGGWRYAGAAVAPIVEAALQDQMAQAGG
ncbi:MAG: hypothetical protein HKN26_02475 [Acidimicrobiales bacterium]|nr:hypothetical protein [Acidimicrobiales bacterium]